MVGLDDQLDVILRGTRMTLNHKTQVFWWFQCKVPDLEKFIIWVSDLLVLRYETSKRNVYRYNVLYMKLKLKKLLWLGGIHFWIE